MYYNAVHARNSCDVIQNTSTSTNLRTFWIGREECKSLVQLKVQIVVAVSSVKI